MLKQNCTWLFCVVAMVSLAAFVGCPSSNDNARTVEGDPPGDHSGHDHGEHGETGPHGGHLIELGRNHEYHAELVENHDAEQVSIYILDSHMKELAIDASPLSLTVTVEGEAKTFELAAANAVDGKASRFDASGNELFHAFEDHEEVEGKLRVTINGTPYVGAIDHHGHHEGHSHEDEH